MKLNLEKFTNRKRAEDLIYHVASTYGDVHALEAVGLPNPIPMQLTWLQSLCITSRDLYYELLDLTPCTRLRELNVASNGLVSIFLPKSLRIANFLRAPNLLGLVFDEMAELVDVAVFENIEVTVTRCPNLSRFVCHTNTKPKFDVPTVESLTLVGEKATWEAYSRQDYDLSLPDNTWSRLRCLTLHQCDLQRWRVMYSMLEGLVKLNVMFCQFSSLSIASESLERISMHGCNATVDLRCKNIQKVKLRDCKSVNVTAGDVVLIKVSDDFAGKTEWSRT